MTIETPVGDPLHEEEEIDRIETGVRILLSLLFVVIARVVGALFGLLVLFGLLYALVTGRRPSPEVRRFARRVIRYIVEVMRYLSYNDDDPPFPFRELPPEPTLEPEEEPGTGGG
jgi:hypothetical protein